MSEASPNEVELRKYAFRMLGHMVFLALHFYAWTELRDSQFRVVNYLFVTVPLHLIYAGLALQPTATQPINLSVKRVAKPASPSNSETA